MFALEKNVPIWLSELRVLPLLATGKKEKSFKRRGLFCSSKNSLEAYPPPLYILCSNPSLVCCLCSSELINIFARSNLLLLRPPILSLESNFFTSFVIWRIIFYGEKHMLPKHFNWSTRAGRYTAAFFMETFSKLFHLYLSLQCLHIYILKLCH